MIRTSLAKPGSRLAFAALLVLCMSGLAGPAGAENWRKKKPDVQAIQGSIQGPPVVAIISMKDQRISLYDAGGNAMRARVSTGRFDYETPVGIYSILQKNKEHYSNVYDDAAMPFMQRITWSGVSLHQGELPGYPASHGCVRMPWSFAEQIFPLTRIGMRVVIARDDVAPVDIIHPSLLKPAPLADAAVAIKAAYDNSGTTEEPDVFQADVRNWPQRQAEMDALKAIAEEKSAAAELTKAPVEELKRDLADKTAQRDKLAKVLRAAEKVKRSADDKAARADRTLTSAKDPAKLKKWEAAAVKAAADAINAESKLAAATAQLQTITDPRQRTKAERALRAAERAKRSADNDKARADRELAYEKSPDRYKKWEAEKAKADTAAAAVNAKFTAAKAQADTAEAALQQTKTGLVAAEGAMNAAITAARDAQRKTFPVSIFVSLKTQRLYVRQGHEPVIDVPVTIADPAKPIGTHVFTAVDYTDNGNGLRWNAVSIGRRPGVTISDRDTKKSRRDEAFPEPYPTNLQVASAALDRVNMPPEVLARFSQSVWPGSSVIVSDEALSKETGNATDFVVLISGEPQGGIKRRPKPVPQPLYRYDPYGYNPNYYSSYNNYGRPVRIQKKPIFSWW